VNTALLQAILEVRIREMMRFYDAGCPEEYVEAREEVEHICAQLEEKEDARRILEFLRTLYAN
jgi:hypothetical protein